MAPETPTTAGTRGEPGTPSRVRLHHALVVSLLCGGVAIGCAAGLFGLVRGAGSPLVAWSSAAACGLALADHVRRWRSGAWTSTSLAPFRTAISSAVIGSAVYVTWLQPYDGPSFLSLQAAVFGVHAIGLGLAARVWNGDPPSGLRHAEFWLFNLCLAPVIAEIGLRGLSSVSASPLLARAGATVTSHVARNRFPPGYLHFGSRCDDRGFPDTSPRREPGSHLVVVIGDSFSVGVVPRPLHYTTVAEQALEDAEVYNVGVVGVGPAEYLHLLREDVLPMRPDHVVIALFVGNDVAASLRILRRDSLLMDWFDRRNLLLVQAPRRWMRIAAERRRLQGAAVGAGQGMPDREIAQDRESLGQQFPWIDDPALEHESFSRATYFDVVEENLRGAFLPEDGKSYEALFRILTTMREVAGDVPLSVLLIPDEAQVEDGLWEAVVTERLGSTRIERDLPQQRIGAWLESEGIPFLDLLPVLREVPPLEDGDRHLFHLRDTHFNARGNAVVGKALSEFLRTTGPR